MRTRTRDISNLGPPPKPEGDPKYVPLPSLLDGEDWEVKEMPPKGLAFVTNRKPGGPLQKRIMGVPFGGELAQRKVRLHEMAHARWTPEFKAFPEGMTPETLNAVEDCRMHKRLSEQPRFKETLAAPLFSDEDYREVWGPAFAKASAKASGDPSSGDGMDPIDIAGLLLGTHRTSEYEPLAELAEAHGFDWVREIAEDVSKEYFGGRRPAFRNTLAAGRDLTERFAAKEREEQEKREQDPRMSEVLDSAKRNVESEKRRYRMSGTKPPKGLGEGRWAEMRIVQFPRVLRIPAALKSRRSRPSDEGAVPAFWHRLPIDQRVFSRKRKKAGGGTILVDQSGSMSLTTGEVLAIMSRWPGVVIAGYAGEGQTGELRIHAMGGRRVKNANLRFPFGNNLVDGPALEWLSRMPGPRIWISDGMVTGIGADGGGVDGIYANLLDDALRICIRGKITRIANVRDLIGEDVPDVPEEWDEDEYEYDEERYDEDEDEICTCPDCVHARGECAGPGDCEICDA